MSSTEFYLNKGYSPFTRATAFYGANTISVWTPVSGRIVAITSVCVANPNNQGTIAFYYDSTTEQKIAEFMMTGSATIFPAIGAWESTVVSGRIFARVQQAGAQAYNVSLTGFEIPVSEI